MNLYWLCQASSYEGELFNINKEFVPRVLLVRAKNSYNARRIANYKYPIMDEQGEQTRGWMDETLVDCSKFILTSTEEILAEHFVM